MYEPTYDIPDRDARRWAMFCHFGGVARLTFIPFAAIIIPLIVWLAKRDEHPFIDDQGKEAINFQITATLVNFGVCLLLVIPVLILKIVGIDIRFGAVTLLLILAETALSLYAGIKSNEGIEYRYPVALRFLT